MREDLELVQALCGIESGLSDWEVEFVESITERVEQEGRLLTPNQRDKASQIAEEAGV